MQNKIKRKYIFSALFDVRPVTMTGDLDMPKIRKAGRILDLRNIEINQEVKEIYKQEKEKAVKIQAFPVKKLKPIINKLNLNKLDADFGFVQIVKKEKKIIKPKTKLKPKIIKSSITQAELAKLDWEFGEDVDDPVGAYGDTPVQNELPVKEINKEINKEIDEKIEAQENKFPTKDEILAEFADIEKIDNIESILTKQLEKPEKQELSELEKIYTQEDNINYKTERAYARPKWACPAPYEVAKHQTRSLIGFVITGVLIALIIPGATLLSRGISMRNKFVNNIENTEANIIITEEPAQINKFGQIILNILERMPGNSEISLENLSNILGDNKEKNYLLLFQDNNEMRATGGLIKNYGLLKLHKSEITELFIDDIFNIDAQLREKIIPPKSIQKVSTAWSIHDANWFADFPTSAKKILWFYERASGQSIDGVISLTFTARELLQEKEYSTEVIAQCLEEKHILVYFKDKNLQELISNKKISGNILSADKDYFSVVSSNINSFENNKAIQQSIEHVSDIQEDGSIINNINIFLTSQEDINIHSNYLRVYLPLGSELISVQGNSLKKYIVPIDYEENNFQKDNLVNSIENNMIVDKTGTEIFTESNKTVFGNWVDIQPNKTAVLSYKYKLPFKADNYSLLAQKQSGSIDINFSHTGIIDYIGDLNQDRFLETNFEF